jgi:hypothetical protein
MVASSVRTSATVARRMPGGRGGRFRGVLMGLSGSDCSPAATGSQRADRDHRRHRPAAARSPLPSTAPAVPVRAGAHDAGRSQPRRRSPAVSPRRARCGPTTVVLSFLARPSIRASRTGPATMAAISSSDRAPGWRALAALGRGRRAVMAGSSLLGEIVLRQYLPRAPMPRSGDPALTHVAALSPRCQRHRESRTRPRRRHDQGSLAGAEGGLVITYRTGRPCCWCPRSAICWSSVFRRLCA